MPYEYDPHRIYSELRGYSPVGTRVQIGGWRWREGYTGTIIREEGAAIVRTHAGAITGGNVIDFVRLDRPVPFEEHVRAMNVQPENRGALHAELKRFDCIDKHDRVTCVWVSWGEIEVETLAPGVLVEYQGPFNKEVMAHMSWPGRVVGVEGNVVLLETLQGTAFMDAPDAIVIRAIRPGFYSENTYILGYDTYRFWRKMEPSTLLPGRVPPNRKDRYEFEEPVPLAVVEGFCKRWFASRGAKLDERCMQSSVILYIMPIEEGYGGGVFRPLRYSLVDEYAASIERASAMEMRAKSMQQLAEEARRMGIDYRPETVEEEWGPPPEEEG